MPGQEPETWAVVLDACMDVDVELMVLDEHDTRHTTKKIVLDETIAKTPRRGYHWLGWVKLFSSSARLAGLCLKMATMATVSSMTSASIIYTPAGRGHGLIGVAAKLDGWPQEGGSTT